MIYVDNPSMNPFYNFALEEYLLKERVLGDEVFLFWRTEPTLMIGNYQNTAAEINEDYVRKKGINVVRRASGGGTIYTDPGGWQFSFIAQAGGGKIDFKRYAEPIVKALRHLGAKAYFNSRNDLLIDDKKISGNAQYHSGDGVIHHGSLLFDTDLEELVRSITVSDDKLIAKGIKSVRQRVANIRPYLEKDISSLEFKDAMLSLLTDKNSYALLGSADQRRIMEIAEKYRSWDWNYGRAPKLSFVRGRRFAGGRVDIYLDMENGIITKCCITGDFFCSVDISFLEKALVGQRFIRSDLSKSLFALSRSLGKEIIHLVSPDELIDMLLAPD